MKPGPGQHPELAEVVGLVSAELAAASEAREAGLAACRRVIRSAGKSIRCVHRLDRAGAEANLAEADAALRQAQAALADFPAITHAGFLHDAEKEYAEAVLTARLVDGAALPSPEAVGVRPPAWLNGLAEAASELRRHLLDRLREGATGRAEELLGAMEATYEALLGVDSPDAVTGGLRRSADALRAVLERTRSDLTTTLLQERLRQAIASGCHRPLG